MIYWQLLWVYLKIGMFGFGGGYAMLSLIQHEIVDLHHWLTPQQFTDVVAISQMTPGPIGINSATYVGYAVTQSVWRLRENIPCALYALEVTDEAYARAKRRADHMMNHGELYRFNSVGLLLCALHIRWNRRRHYFCSQFVSEVLQKSGSLFRGYPAVKGCP